MSLRVALLTSLTLLTAGCSHSWFADARPNAPQADATTHVPTLPPPSPEVVDSEGCSHGLDDEGRPEADCPIPVTEHVDEDPDGHRSVAGFHGPYFTDDLSLDEVVVMEQSVTSPQQGRWRAQGLVRNETATARADVRVLAVLLDSSGRTLGQARATTPINPLRPGEPAPFTMTADVLAQDVASVTWTVAGTPTDATPPREVQLSFGDTVPSGDRDPIDNGDYRDRGRPPYPFVSFGYAENVGDAVPRPTVVGAWLDADGRVVWVDSTPVIMFGAPPLDVLEPDTLAEFRFVIDDGDARLAEQTPIVWLVSS